VNDLIPIGKVLKENPRVQELERYGFIVKPKKLDSYLEDFQERRSSLSDKNLRKGKKVLINGISRFAGSHLAEGLLNMGSEVHGTIRCHAVTMLEKYLLI
jgi:hypothetical protein